MLHLPSDNTVLLVLVDTVSFDQITTDAQMKSLASKTKVGLFLHYPDCIGQFLNFNPKCLNG